MAPSSLRWGRIALGGFLAEVLLLAAVIPLYATGSSEQSITVLAVAGSFFALLALAWWLCRSIYYLAHVLKLAGGATGGWLAQRRVVA